MDLFFTANARAKNWLNRRLRAAAFVCAVICLYANIANAQQVTLSPDELRIFAARATDTGNNDEALDLTAALLKRNPDDVAALVIRSRALRNLGRFDDARSVANQAWRKAEDPSEKFGAALVTAQALASDGKRTRAQLWLRRAVQSAPDDAAKATAIRDFQYVRRRNPWRVDLSFDLTPSANLNGGSRREFLTIDNSSFVAGLSGSAQALSGTKLSFQGSVSYLISERERHRTQIGFAFYRSFNSLSSSARDQAPDLKGSDLDYGLAELRLSHRRIASKSVWPDRYDLSYNQIWYGGQALERQTKLSLSKGVPLSPTDSLRISGKWDWRKSDRNQPDRYGRSVSLQYSHAFKNRDRLSVTFAAEDVLTQDRSQRGDGQRLSVSYARAKPIGPVRLSGQIGYNQRDYPDFDLVLPGLPRGRQDKRVNASIAMSFDEINLYGFKPVLTLSAERTQSNISRYETEDFGLALGFRSAF